MLQKPRMRKLELAFVAAGALSLSAWTGAEARPFGLLLGGGFHHLGGFGGFHPLGGFGGGFHPGGFGDRIDGRAFGLRQAGLGYPGFRQAGPGDRSFEPARVDRRWRSGSGRGRYWGAAPLTVGATGAYSYAYTSTDTNNGDYPAYRHHDRPAYRN